MTEYHHIFLALPDIYRDAGPFALKELASKKEGRRNLLVLPAAFDKIMREHQGGRVTINEIEKKSRPGSPHLLNKREAEKYIQKNPELNESVLTIRYSDSLDIAFQRGSSIDEITDHKVEEIFTRIGKRWTINEKNKPKLVTSDPSMHLRFRAMGLVTELPGFLTPKSDTVHEGLILGNEKIQSELHQNGGKISVEDASEILERERGLYPNQFIYFRGQTKEYAVVLGNIVRNKSGSRILQMDNLELRLLKPEEYSKKLKIGQQYHEGLLGIKPRDMEQYLALQYGVLNPDIELFFICGGQGSGKTILSYPGAIELILRYNEKQNKKRGLHESQESFYKQVLITKPTDIIGGRSRELGFLPGSLYEKMLPHLAPFEDAHNKTTLTNHLDFEDMFRHGKRNSRYGPRRGFNGKIENIAELPEGHAITFENTGYIRGRSISDTIIIVDEAQNLSPYEIKTIIERTGEHTKLILLGDPLQVDRGTIERNGLTWAMAHYLQQPYSGGIYLPHNYRSQMSDDARELFAFSDGS
ncbi:MAG: PhoH family protein [Nanoarchaeota archaeon]|nr:PhoH family protein [Nanoarchaeota archaeon]